MCVRTCMGDLFAVSMMYITCLCCSVVNALVCNVQWSVTRLRRRVQFSKLGPGTSAFHQRIISNDSDAHSEQGDNPGQEKEGSTMSSIICDRC